MTERATNVPGHPTWIPGERVFAWIERRSGGHWQGRSVSPQGHHVTNWYLKRGDAVNAIEKATGLPLKLHE